MLLRSGGAHGLRGTGSMMFKRISLVSILSVALCCSTALTPAQAASSTVEQSSSTFQQLVVDIQRMLTELGYRPGPVDGAIGDRTRQAIRRYQSNTSLPVDGHPSEGLRQHLRVTTGAAAPASHHTTQTAAKASTRKAAWQGQAVSDALLRIAPSAASASRQRIGKGAALEVIRRQGPWLEVRVKSSGAEGWVKQESVRAAAETASAAPKKESGGFFSNLARGVARLLGGSSDAPQNQGTVTVGIRGLAAEDLENAIPNPGELDRMEGFRADREQAYRFAGAEQLTAQSVDYIPDSASSPSSTAAPDGRD